MAGDSGDISYKLGEGRVTGTWLTGGYAAYGGIDPQTGKVKRVTQPPLSKVKREQRGGTL